MNQPQPAKNQASRNLGGRSIISERRVYTPKGKGGGITVQVNEIDNLTPQLNGDKITVTNGLVLNETPQIGGVDLDAITTPELTLTEATDLYLVGDLAPASFGAAYDGTTYYGLISGGTFDNAHFILSTTAINDVVPTVHNTTPASNTDGSYAIKWATITGNPTDGFNLTVLRSGNLTVEFHYPGSYTNYHP